MPTSMSLSGIPNDPDVIATALLQCQFFPHVKAQGEELPPFFSSSTFTPAVASKLTGHHPHGKVNYVTFRTRRFDGLVRRLGLPHPVPYAKLVLHIKTHWVDLIPHLTSEESRIKPIPPGEDGRVIAMDYGSIHEKTISETRAAQGRRYAVDADISNFFPSLYTHSIDWALRGIDIAKGDQGGTSWESKVDKYVQACHYGETTGVMIGPAISNILSELVLQAVDEQLRTQGYSFVRFIDDFRAYFDTRDEAEVFIAALDRALTKYRLVLNTKKTRVTSLREGFGNQWIGEIHSSIPEDNDPLAAIRFLQKCEHVTYAIPTASILVYGVKALLNKRNCPHIGAPRAPTDLSTELPVLEEMTRLNYFHPHLSCFLARQLARVADLLPTHDRDRIAEQLRRQMREAAQRNETDTVLWMIFSIRKLLKKPLLKRDAQQLIMMDDDLVWVALASTSKNSLRWVTERVRAMDRGITADIEAHWLCRYELFRTGALKSRDISPTAEEPWFRAAQSAGLSFSFLK